MNVYDFDKTIYKNDCTVDFYFYEIARHPSLIRFLPGQIWGFLGRFLRIHDKTVMKSYFYKYLKGIKDIDSDIDNFWDSHIQKVNNWYFVKHLNDDLVISASADFMVRPACERLGITNVIASLVDKKTGEVLSPNCHGKEKVVRFVNEGFNKEEIEEFYSDSVSDTPLAELSQSAYIVKGEKLVEWPKK